MRFAKEYEFFYGKAELYFCFETTMVLRPEIERSTCKGAFLVFEFWAHYAITTSVKSSRNLTRVSETQ